MSKREDIAVTLHGLEKSNGRLIPEDVVEAARDPESPLHKHFTWDDSEAASKQRLHEARTLIRTVQIEVKVRDIPIMVCGYVRDPEANAKQGGYRNITVVKSEEDLARSAIIDEMKRVASAVSRAKRIAAVLGIVQDIEAIETLANTLTAKIAESQQGAQA